MKPVQVKICVTLDNSEVVILSIVLDDGKNIKREATNEYVDALIAQSSAKGWSGQPVSWRFITDADLPSSRDYRAAWEDGGSGPLRINSQKRQAIQAEIDTLYSDNQRLAELQQKERAQTITDAEVIESARLILRWRLRS